jgi:hypothetical protein
MSSFNSYLKTSDGWFILFLLFYGVQFIFAILGIIDVPFVDFYFVLGVLVFFFFLNRKYKFSRIVPICLGLGALLHIIGLYNIIPYNEYYTGTLYGWGKLSYHYDLIAHIWGMFFISIASCSLFYFSLKKGFNNNKILIFIILIFLMLGVGAFNEMLEYTGFTFLGHGLGFLKYGDGDSSPIEGPWENSSMDMFANLLGIVLGVSIFLIRKNLRGT